ncbi:hypothetical protein, partial [Vibrio coralliilyticus]|uniref:hypothetical protein n=1 Tax=Vibrio coralliilyticus TaxID=190893 RepID=UPI001C1298B2
MVGGVVIAFRCTIRQCHSDCCCQFTRVAQRDIKDGGTAFIDGWAGDAGNVWAIIVRVIPSTITAVVNKRRRFRFAITV